MILCPIENSALIEGFTWIQVRPRVTQKFGENPQIYTQLGLKAHNGIDFGVPEGTPVYAPFDGKVRIGDDGKKGYGQYVKIRNSNRVRECVLGHLSKIKVLEGAQVNMGDQIGYSGNTGFSTGPHLHLGMRFISKASGDVFSWPVANYDNGYFGYVDPINSIITFKGKLETTTIKP